MRRWESEQYAKFRDPRSASEFSRYIRGLTVSIVLQMVVIFVSAAAFFLWNYLQNVFGPGG